MDQQEMEVELKVIKERQNIQGHKLKDVDECCGNLKGSLNAEIRVLAERIVKVEEHMDANCIDVEKKVDVLEERVDTNTKMIDTINTNFRQIRYLIYAAILTSLLSIILK